MCSAASCLTDPHVTTTQNSHLSPVVETSRDRSAQADAAASAAHQVGVGTCQYTIPRTVFLIEPMMQCWSNGARAGLGQTRDLGALCEVPQQPLLLHDWKCHPIRVSQREMSTLCCTRSGRRSAVQQALPCRPCKSAVAVALACLTVRHSWISDERAHSQSVCPPAKTLAETEVLPQL